MNQITKELVNKEYCCRECTEHDYCEFWKGSNFAYECGGCNADVFAEGAEKMLEALATKLPFDRVFDLIKIYKEGLNEPE